MQITPGKWYQRNGQIADVIRVFETGTASGFVITDDGRRYSIVWMEGGKACATYAFADLVCPYDEPIERPAKPTREALMAERPI